jgi:4'-phosphopantetheinyl transferase EntD
VPIDSQFLGLRDSAAANPATLSATFASLFPSGVVAAELRAPGDASLLWPEEAASVANAVPKRIQEFAAGRLCARRALAEFGVTSFPVRVAHDRLPLWPEWLVGSITHTSGLCAAVVAERTREMALGVDSEVVGAAKAELWTTICAPAEMAWLDTLPRADQAAAATLIFSAKEAFYKCQYPLVGEWLNFHDLCIAPLAWGESQGTFAVHATRPIAFFNRLAATARAVPAVRCSYLFHNGFVSAGVCLAAPKETSAQRSDS